MFQPAFQRVFLKNALCEPIQCSRCIARHIELNKTIQDIIKRAKAERLELKEIMNQGTVQGLPKLMLEGIIHHPIRTVFAICCTIAVMYMISACFDNYQNPRIKQAVKLSENETIFMPAVTVCPPHLYTMNWAAIGKLTNSPPLKYRSGESNGDWLWNINESVFTDQTIKGIWNQVYLGRKKLLKEKNREYFKDNPNRLKYEITQNLFLRCFTMRVKKNPVVAHEFTHIYLDLALPDFVDGDVEMMNPTWIVYIHEEDEPFMGNIPYCMNYPSWQVNVKKKYRFELDILTLRKISLRNNPCVQNNSLSTAKCQIDCWKRLTLSGMNCTIPLIDLRSGPLPYCDNKEVTLNLTRKAINTFGEILSKCRCPTRCFRRIYSYRFFQPSPNTRVEGRDYNEPVIEFVTDDTSTNDVTEMIEYGWIKLIADIGGSVGMFLGLSLLSLHRVVEWAWMKIRYGEVFERP